MQEEVLAAARGEAGVASDGVEVGACRPAPGVQEAAQQARLLGAQRTGLDQDVRHHAARGRDVGQARSREAREGDLNGGWAQTRLSGHVREEKHRGVSRAFRDPGPRCVPRCVGEQNGVDRRGGPPQGAGAGGIRGDAPHAGGGPQVVAPLDLADALQGARYVLGPLGGDTPQVEETSP